MEVTPQLLRDVTFRSQRRGYDCDQVDDFLERVETGVADLQAQLSEAHTRLERAEARAENLQQRLEKAEAKAGDSTEDEALRRTLVLAQRTADAAIKEAEEYAERIRAEADDHAARMHAEVDARVARAVRDAEEEAKRGAIETRQRLVEEIIELEALRDSVRADVVTLERHHEEQRLRLRAAVAELQRMVDDPASLRGMPPPELREVSLPDDLRPARAAGDVDAGTAAAEAGDVDLDEPEDKHQMLDDELAEGDATEDDDVEIGMEADEDDAELEEPTAGDGEDDAGRDEAADEDDLDAELWGPASEEEPSPAAARARAVDDVDEEADADSGLSTEAVHIPEGPEGDDAYLAELRKAMLADDDDLPPLPPLSDEPLGSRRPRSRFGRRR